MSLQEDEAEDAHRYILDQYEHDGSESGLIGIPLGWGLYGSEPECTVVELSGEFKLGPTRCMSQAGGSSPRLV